MRVNQLDGRLDCGLVLRLVFRGSGKVSTESVFFKPEMETHGLINSENKIEYLKWGCSKKIKDHGISKGETSR